MLKYQLGKAPLRARPVPAARIERAMVRTAFFPSSCQAEPSGTSARAARLNLLTASTSSDLYCAIEARRGRQSGPTDKARFCDDSLEFTGLRACENPAFPVVTGSTTPTNAPDLRESCPGRALFQQVHGYHSNSRKSGVSRCCSHAVRCWPQP
jgi:hypothetical protein